jgi:hypothetical protein
MLNAVELSLFPKLHTILLICVILTHWFVKIEWNLRPRTESQPSPTPKGEGEWRNPEEPTSKYRTRRGAAVAAKELKLPLFSLSLTKEEIEADFLLMTGAPPPKKPQTRPKAVQKHLKVTIFMPSSYNFTFLN